MEGLSDFYGLIIVSPVLVILTQACNVRLGGIKSLGQENK